MVLIACGQISQHRVDSRRQGHQIARVGRHNLVNAPAKIIETDIHMQRGTNVQADHQPVQFSHHNIF
jgi:hypothetical protein